MDATLTFLPDKDGERAIGANGLDLFYLKPVEDAPRLVEITPRLPGHHGRTRDPYTVNFDPDSVWEMARLAVASDWSQWLTNVVGTPESVHVNVVRGGQSGR